LVNIWKVIFSTLVIFAAGLATGSFLSRESKPQQQPVLRPEPAPPVPAWIVQQRFLQTLKRELDLNPDQVKRLDSVFEDSRQRMRILMELINPELQAEKREVADKIRAELTPDQRVKFEQLLKHPHRPGERKGTNNTPSMAKPPKT
jgi:Spy/CpxP family protein refolding chaperone